ncbi:MAG: CcoQ/FixQ family Cbb3-type cytochrome c oxidase assembly chaperone [Chitinophagaceae bacterium]|jgi:cytochrome c oxidase cbb3-type subunit 4
MKFSHYLEKITGVSIYPIISLTLFVAFFTLVTIWILKMDKNELAKAEQLPL